MKIYILLLALILIGCYVESEASNGSSDIFVLKKDANSGITFDEDSQYLKINIESFKKEQPENTSFVQRVFGKEANLILGMVELTYQGEKTALPIFKFGRTTDKKYKYESIGVNADHFNKVIRDNLIYRSNDLPTLSFSIKRWTKDNDINLIESLLKSATGLNSIGDEAVDQAKIINSLILNIVNTVNPSDDNEQVINIELNKSNIQNGKFSVFYEKNLIKEEDDISYEDPLITFSIETEDSQLINSQLVDYLEKYPNPQLKFFEQTIMDADNSFKKGGNKEGILNSLRRMEKYLEELDLTILDKKLIVGRALTEWAVNAIQKGLNLNDYISLKYDDVNLASKLINHPFFNEEQCVVNDTNCKSPECNTLAYYLSLSFHSLPKELQLSLPCLLTPRINFTFDDVYEGVFQVKEFINIFRPVAYNKFDDEVDHGASGKDFIINKFKFLYNGEFYKTKAIFRLIKRDGVALLKDVELTQIEETP
ncbi:hypothetical protein OAQ99_04480 [Candidatus Kapabacteria bacterium]|nr:hypothetical protein [Candidatus Kapabacteria bacterium]